VACVVGGTGFVGSHVADRLSGEGYEVRVFDRTPSPWLRLGQVMLQGDLLDPRALDRAVSDCDGVFHFAGLANLNEALERPVEAAEVNVLGTVKLLEACRRAGVRRFLYASTMYVFSREGGFYRASKQSAELFVEDYGRQFGIDFVILRFGSIYGPGSGPGNGLFRIVRAALADGQLSYPGSAEAVREYIHVADVAQACLDAVSGPFSDGSLVVTGRESTSVAELLLMIAEILGLDPRSVRFDSSVNPGHYVRTPCADVPRLSRRCTPALHVDLGQGMLDLVEYVRSGLDASPGSAERGHDQACRRHA
jgi:UDP-glucose 4-epimerase